MIEIYNSRNLEINIDAPYTIEDHLNFTFKIRVNQFYGERSFCIHVLQLKESIKQLQLVYAQQFGKVRWNDYDSESYLCIEMNEEKVMICGRLGGEMDENVWTFQQAADQTVIPLLIKAFQKLTK